MPRLELTDRFVARSQGRQGNLADRLLRQPHARTRVADIRRRPQVLELCFHSPERQARPHVIGPLPDYVAVARQDGGQAGARTFWRWRRSTCRHAAARVRRNDRGRAGGRLYGRPRAGEVA